MKLDKKEAKQYNTIHFVATDEIREYLERVSAQQERSISWYIRDLIKRDMDKEKAPA